MQRGVAPFHSEPHSPTLTSFCLEQVSRGSFSLGRNLLTVQVEQWKDRELFRCPQSCLLFLVVPSWVRYLTLLSFNFLNCKREIIMTLLQGFCKTQIATQFVKPRTQGAREMSVPPYCDCLGE